VDACYLGGFLLHFFLLLTVSCQQTFWVLANGYTSLPSSLEKYWRKAEAATGFALGERFDLANRVRQTVSSYIESAGIEGGYGFFAPGVPNSYKLVFELHYGDGRIEYDLPHVTDVETGLRLSSLLDQIGRASYEPLRELMVKMLAYAMWQVHPDAVTIRAVFGYVEMPSVAELKQGKGASYNFLYAYDFSFAGPSGRKQRR
jgi:hypothetical protein